MISQQFEIYCDFHCYFLSNLFAFEMSGNADISGCSGF